MEIASPLAFSHATSGSKRSFPCSPNPTAKVMESSLRFRALASQESHSAINIANNFQNQSFKRRRRVPIEQEDDTPSRNHGIVSTSPLRNACATTGSSFKRARHDNNSNDLLPGQKWNQFHAQQQINCDLQAIVEKQNKELERVRVEKTDMELRVSEMKNFLEKTSNENRILKRAVTIQQERQNAATSELNAACKYRSEAEERIRRLEQMVNNLRFHLQATNRGPVNDFMGFGPQPPGVC